MISGTVRPLRGRYTPYLLAADYVRYALFTSCYKHSPPLATFTNALVYDMLLKVSILINNKAIIAF